MDNLPRSGFSKYSTGMSENDQDREIFPTEHNNDYIKYEILNL